MKKKKKLSAVDKVSKKMKIINKKVRKGITYYLSKYNGENRLKWEHQTSENNERNFISKRPHRGRPYIYILFQK